MFKIELKDGNKIEFDSPISGIEIAKKIAVSLAKKALAINIDGVISDLRDIISTDAKIEIITEDSEDGLDVLRHDAAHILAQAVKELYEDVEVTIGPVTDSGFYYDFATKKSFHPDDLVKIEKRMGEIVKDNLQIERIVKTRIEAIEYFKSIGENYKVEIIEAIPENEIIYIYKQGDFIDLCRGPHSLSTGHVKAFKLMKIAGAYWRGDCKNQMLQRIYGTAFATKSDLDAYLHMLEESEKRDHRKLGKEMHLFHFQEEAPGAVFWHPKGWKLFMNLVSYMRKKQQENGYDEISTPEIMDKSLWEASGHWEKFSHNMFTAHSSEEHHKIYAVRPMNCPGSIQYYRQGIKSYRDLPIRISEFGKVHRFEPSGSLHGLLRVRAFTQDDAHIFCTEEQIEEECVKICELVKQIYYDFGFDDIKIKFSDRPEKRIGSDEIWDKAESALMSSIKSQNIEYTVNKGEGAFYGPKIEFVLRDAIGRDWQLGTVQVDFNLPVRLDANYIDEHGTKKRPVMIHRALFGSLERFIGILIEHHSGHLPIWITPIHGIIATISEDANIYALELYDKFKVSGLDVRLDVSNEQISYKIRKHSLEKIPYIFVVGKNEKQNNTVSVRALGSDEQKTMTVDDVLNYMKKHMYT